MSHLWRLLGLYRPHWRWLALGVAAALVALLANIALMTISGWFIAAMALTGAAGGAMNYFGPAALIRLAAMLRIGGRYGERLATHEAAFRAIARIRVWLFGKIEPLAPGTLERYHSGDLLSRLRADVDRLEGAYLRLFTPLAVGLMAMAVMVGWLAFLDFRLGALEGGFLALFGLAIPAFLARLSALRGRRRVRLAADLEVAAVDMAQGLPELLVFGAMPAFQKNFAATGGALVEETRRLDRLSGLSQAGVQLGGQWALWGMVVLGIPLVGHALTPADLPMVALAALATFEAVAPLPAAFLGLSGVVEAATRIFALADTPPAPSPPAGPKPVPGRCDIAVSGLDFAYGEGPPVFRNFDFDLPRGGRVAIVEPNGVGKSTLTLLLAGLLVPSGGRILVDGQPTTAYDGEILRRCFAVAPQQPGLISGTIRDILRLGAPEADDDALMAVLTVVGLDGFVAELPQKLGTWIGEAGLTVSGGQARRLSIARALLRDAPVLILDEPGEGLDPPAERALLAAVMAGLGDRSLLLITHRAAGLDLVDRVVRL